MLSRDDTICALATGARSGGVGIVRISGSAAEIVLRRVAPAAPERLRPQRLYYVTFVDPGSDRPIDQGYAVLMPAPHSYTAEDVAELHGHGGAANLRRLLAAAIAAGARPAERGEFSLRAFLNGRIDLSQAEAVADVVAARTETALDLAHDQLRGGLSDRVRHLTSALTGVRVHLEAQIDFSEEDLGPSDAAVTGRLHQLHERVSALARTFDRGRVLRDGVRVVLMGPPNAGKSSLFNALLRTSRAIVTDVPGTTRDFLEETLDLDGLPVSLVDTAGVRRPGDVVEAAGVERALALARHADLVLLLRDATDPGPAITLEGIPEGRVYRIRTKADLAPGDVSALTGEGLDTLLATLRQRLLPEASEATDRIVVTRARHHAALRAAATALEAAHAAADAGEPPDIVAVDVAEASYQLGLIVGLTTTEDLLDRIFSEFCIGK